METGQKLLVLWIVEVGMHVPPNAEFYSANCGKPKDYIVINSGPIAKFRADNMVLDFKDLSIREIQPTSNLTLVAINTL